MALSGVQTQTHEYSFFTEKKAASGPEDAFQQALQEAGLLEADAADARSAEAAQGETAAERLSSAVDKFSLIGMLMESLFLAEIEENQTSGSASGQAGEPEQQAAGKPEKSANPLHDGDKVAELKRVITDFTSGKANLSDLPQAMAMGSSKAGNASLASKGSNASVAKDNETESKLG